MHRSVVILILAPSFRCCSARCVYRYPRQRRPSRLIDLLGVRVLVIPVAPAVDEVEPRLSRDLPIVDADEDVKVLEDQRPPGSHSICPTQFASRLKQPRLGPLG